MSNRLRDWLNCGDPLQAADRIFVLAGRRYRKSYGVKLLQQFAGRCPRIHCKDVAPEGENQDQMGFADVGYGTLDWSALLPAAKAAGAEWYIVEHDLPKQPLASVKRSFEFLAKQLA